MGSVINPSASGDLSLSPPNPVLMPNNYPGGRNSGVVPLPSHVDGGYLRMFNTGAGVKLEVVGADWVVDYAWLATDTVSTWTTGNDFLGFCYIDVPNTRIYAISQNAGATDCALIYMDYSTGSLTLVGTNSDIAGWFGLASSVHYCHMSKNAAGNFVLHDTFRQGTISGSDGSTVSAVANVQRYGKNLDGQTTYPTAATVEGTETLYQIGDLGELNSGDPYLDMELCTDTDQALILVPVSAKTPCMIGNNECRLLHMTLAEGEAVAFWAVDQATTHYNGQVYMRDDYDAWLRRIARAAGLIA